MNYRRKLKSSSSVSIFLPAFISYVVFFGSLVIFGKAVAIRLLGFILMSYGLLSLLPYFRTRNYGFLLSSLFMFIMSFFLLTIPPHLVFDSNSKSIPTYSALLIVFILTLMIVLIYLSYKRKLK